MTSFAVCLLLLLDVSGSVKADHWTLMRHGHAAAFRSPAVIRAIEAGGVAVADMQFASLPLPPSSWRILTSHADSLAYATRLETLPRQSNGFTATGAALHVALDAFNTAPGCDEFIIDLVTDGPADDRHAVPLARDEAMASGIRINAVIVRTDSTPSDATAWLRENAITADGFARIAEGWSDVPRAIGRKLALELAGMDPLP